MIGSKTDSLNINFLLRFLKALKAAIDPNLFQYTNWPWKVQMSNI